MSRRSSQNRNEDGAKRAVVSDLLVLQICDDVGRCWYKLGIMLNLSAATIRNVNDDFRLNREKGREILHTWKERNGSAATVGRLADALEKVEMKEIAQRLIALQIDLENQGQRDVEQTSRSRNPYNDGNHGNTHGFSMSNVHFGSSTNMTFVVGQQVVDTGTRPLAMGRPEPSRPIQAEQVSLTEIDTGTRPLAMGSVEPSGPIPAEHLETSDSQIMDSVERNQACLQCTRLAKELNDLKTQIGRLRHQQQLTHAEVYKYKNAVSRAFLPSEKDFPSPTGVLSSLIRDKSVKPVATRSSEGPGEASDIFYHRKAKESGTDEKMNSWWCVDLSENYRLVITHYALRHGKKDGEAILKHWQLQGSNDKDKWINIYYTPDSSQFRAPHPFFTGRWSVSGEVGAFRYFRILQTGLNSSKKTWNLSIWN